MHIRRVVDLSLAIDADTQVYPGDPHVRFAPAATIDKDGFNLLSVEMGSQSGTNCDAPYHFLDGGTRIDELDLSLFAGRGVIIDVRGKLPRTSIQAADVQPYLDKVGPGIDATEATSGAFDDNTPSLTRLQETRLRTRWHRTPRRPRSRHHDPPSASVSRPVAEESAHPCLDHRACALPAIVRPGRRRAAPARSSRNDAFRSPQMR